MKPDANGDTSPTHRSRRGASRRRFVATVGAAGLTAGLAGCTNSGGGGSQSDISQEDLKYDGENVTVEYTTAPLFGNIADKLKQSMYDAGLPKSIDVKFSTTVWGADDLQERYNQILSSGRSTPDFMLTNFAFTPYFASRGWLLDLTKVFGDKKLQDINNDYSQVMVESMKWDGGLYGIPQFIDIPTIQYRKDLVEDAGFDPEGENWATEPLTWKKFAEVTKKTKQRHDLDNGYTTTLNQRTIAGQTGYEHIVTNGGNYFGDMRNQDGPIGNRPVTIDSESVVRTLKQLRTFMYGESDQYALDGMPGGILPSEALGWDTTPSMKSFDAGQAVTHRNWSFAIAQFGAKESFGEKLGVMPYPYGVTKEQATYQGTGGTNAQLGGWHLSINPNTEKLAATVEVIKAMTTDSFYLDIFEYTGSSPPKPDLFDSKKAKNVSVMGRYTDTLKFQSNNLWAPPINHVWDSEKDAISQEFHACLNRKKSPQQAVAAAQKQVKQIESDQS